VNRSGGGALAGARSGAARGEEEEVEEGLFAIRNTQACAN